MALFRSASICAFLIESPATSGTAGMPPMTYAPPVLLASMRLCRPCFRRRPAPFGQWACAYSGFGVPSRTFACRRMAPRGTRHAARAPAVPTCNLNPETHTLNSELQQRMLLRMRRATLLGCAILVGCEYRWSPRPSALHHHYSTASIARPVAAKARDLGGLVHADDGRPLGLLAKLGCGAHGGLQLLL